MCNFTRPNIQTKYIDNKQMNIVFIIFVGLKYYLCKFLKRQFCPVIVGLRYILNHLRLDIAGAISKVGLFN